MLRLLAISLLYAAACTSSPASGGSPSVAAPEPSPASTKPSASATTAPAAVNSAAPATTAPAAAESTGPTASEESDCPSPAGSDGEPPSQAPELERLLPPEVDGRRLSRWSVRGRCWLELALGSEPAVDAFIAELESESGEEIDTDQFVYAVAGREDTVNDPPYLVFALRKPTDDFHRELVDWLFVAMAGFADPAEAGSPDSYTERSIGGKAVQVGTPEMLAQDDHQRGRPYLYETDEHTFLVVTESDAWAADAIRQLP